MKWTLQLPIPHMNDTEILLLKKQNIRGIVEIRTTATNHIQSYFRDTTPQKKDQRFRKEALISVSSLLFRFKSEHKAKKTFKKNLHHYLHCVIVIRSMKLNNQNKS